MKGLADSPLRNLLWILAFLLVVVAVSTFAYAQAGWSVGDAFYMALLIIYTVGFSEVHPVNTLYLREVTIATMILGCTGMVLLGAALIQALTVTQIQQFLGGARVKSDIDKLSDHVIVCGFGRIGVMAARDLAASGAAFVVLERDDKRYAEARDLGYLAVQGDATDETVLIAAGVARARVLATVLPHDAANVFITLSARSLNAKLQIIARGEAPTTQTKLIQAGADKVVLPTHIGAERIVEMILFPETARFLHGSDRMRDFGKILRDLGLQMEVVVVDKTAAAGQTIEELEHRGAGAFFVVQINRRDGDNITQPHPSTVVERGDGLVVLGRDGGLLSAALSAPAPRPRAGRTTY